MKKFNPLSFIFVALLILTNSANAQIPSGYYDNALNQTGDDLKDSLHNIIKGHTKFSYSSSNTDVWDILKVADRDPNDSTKVVGIYSGFSMDAASEYNSGSGWNREHVWAKSRGNFGTTQGAGTDLHHLRAADISTNSARNNRNFDYADNYYTDASGYYSGATDSKTSSADWVWEPRDEVKGDIARMIFYMATRYEGDGNEPDLELTELHLNNSDQSPLHSKLSVLLEWHQNDPVSPEEELRNDVIYSYQNNRNPFIDHPEFVCEIYPCVTTTASELFISEYIEGSSYNKAIEIANYTGSTVDLSNYSIKKQANGSGSWTNLTLSGTLADGEVYIVSHSNASSSITNVADMTTSSNSITFNGNDPVALYNSSTLIDIIGTHNGGSSYFAKDVTMVRKASVDMPNTAYTTDEWNIESKDEFVFIGYHEFGTLTKSSIAALEAPEEIAEETILSVYPNPAQYELHYSINENIVDVNVFDVQGKMQNVFVDINSNTLDVSNLSQGIYVIAIQTEKEIKTIQFVKQ